MRQRGGDLRVAGQPPGTEAGATPGAQSGAAGWGVGVENPFGEQLAAVLSLHDGGVATSSRLRRRWIGPGQAPSHHLIDPRTGLPAASGLAAVTVVAATAWQAEMLTKAVFLAGARAGSALVERLGAAGLLVTDEGSVLCTAGLDGFLASGRLPEPEPVAGP